MRRTATEILRDLEIRVARLEKESSPKEYVDLDYIEQLARLFVHHSRGVKLVERKMQRNGREGVFIHLKNGGAIIYELHMGNGLLAKTPDGPIGWGRVSFDGMKEVLKKDLALYANN